MTLHNIFFREDLDVEIMLLFILDLFLFLPGIEHHPRRLHDIEVDVARPLPDERSDVLLLETLHIENADIFSLLLILDWGDVLW